MPLQPTPRVLVVGAAGQVGTQLCNLLGPTRALAAGRSPAAPPHLADIPWLQLDLAHLDPTAATQSITLAQPLSAVLCVAGATDVDRCQREPAWAAAVNTLGPAALARATPAHIPFVFFSTEYVFPGTPANPGPYTESSPTEALSVYGQSKLQGEALILNHRPDALILRTTVVYGPDPAQKNFLYFLHRELSAGCPVRIVDDQISTPTCNDDFAAATLALLDRRTTGLVHVAGPTLLSRFDFALEAARILSIDPTLIHPVSTASLAQPAPRPLRAGLATHLLHSLLGPHAIKSTAQGIRAWAAISLPPSQSATLS